MSGYRERACLLALLCVACSPLRLHCQSTTAGMESATQDRLNDAGWWPTKGDAARNSYAGADSCTHCHEYEAQSQKTTPMAQAGQRVETSPILKRYTALLFVRDPYHYRLSTSGTHSDYSVTEGQHTVAAPLSWAFGVGEYGQTYLYQKDKIWYESEISFYTKPKMLDMTTGHPRVAHTSLEDALGHSLNDADASHCFACHTTMSTLGHQFDPALAVGGITCEGCHGPGQEHIAKMRTGSAAGDSATITNPGRMSPVDSVDFCGACHRTWADVAFLNTAGLGKAVVRFQPYRLEKSRCWGTDGDQRITCIACHNPHEPLNRETSSYDAQCLACHAVRGVMPMDANKKGAACPVSTHQCVSCHMPKYEVKDMHGEFTDHMIRIVRKDEIFPQ